ncbi:MAG TPA: hypothetical protein VJ437_13125 [Acidiferrobacterales bacterium]|nr:hypothetical protein [Acidiferrobacterales bacterium]
MSAESRTCSSCGNSVPVPAALGRSVECHGAPPQLVPTPQGMACVWPQCSPGWWCAVWIAKPVQVFTLKPTEKPTKNTTEDTHGKA